jgi:hypothetical protein
MTAVAGERAVVWRPLAHGRRRAVQVGIDPADLDRALAKWHQLLGPSRILHAERYPAAPAAGPPNPLVGLPKLQHDPAAAMAAHLADQHGIGADTTVWLRDHEGWSGWSASTTWTTPSTPTRSSATPIAFAGDPTMPAHPPATGHRPAPSARSGRRF